jgi:endonuclease/exonuclease/phosphatase family metal-dependent hydrolase
MNSNLNILTYNIHKGFDLTQRFVLESIRENIRAVHADLVFLQEVQAEHSGNFKKINGWPKDQLEFLADEIWPHFAYGKNAIYEEGHHGNAILSKYPIQTFENIDISNNRFERRGILHAVISWNSSPVHLLCVHLDLTAKGRLNQCNRIIERIQNHAPKSERLILAGDFNDWQGMATAHFEERLGLYEAYRKIHGSHAKTFPSPYPFLTLDRVYLRGFQTNEANALSGTPWSRLSDHLAINCKLSAE